MQACGQAEFTVLSVQVNSELGRKEGTNVSYRLHFLKQEYLSRKEEA